MMVITTLSLPSMIMLRKVVKPKLLALFIYPHHQKTDDFESTAF
jgi:uncharacterized membrane protein YraQ (UPF0718 family)